MTILVTGSTGAIGSRVVAGLVAANADVRALVRTPDKANLPGAKIVKGDFDQAETLARALEDVTSVFLLTPPRPDDLAMVERFLDVAVKSRSAPRIVRLSAIKATDNSPSDGARNHGRADRVLLDSGLPYAILRPNYFMQNFLGSAHSILTSGTFSPLPSASDSRVGFIDVRDIADVAVAVLLDRSWDHGIYDLTGSASVSFHEVARDLGVALGREVTYAPVTPEEARESALKEGWGEWGAALLADYSVAYAKGWGDFTTSFVEKITGHKARSIADFAREVFAPALRADRPAHKQSGT
jgi:uncharacterized protein YbjT (DUF2867 family)